MPTYDYRCDVCGHRVEVVHGVHGHGPRVCPNCGAEGPMRKLISAPAIHFKGSGWAKKDRRATAVPGASKTEKAPESVGEDRTAKGEKDASPDGKGSTGSKDTPAGAASAAEPRPSEKAAG